MFLGWKNFNLFDFLVISLFFNVDWMFFVEVVEGRNWLVVIFVLGFSRVIRNLDVYCVDDLSKFVSFFVFSLRLLYVFYGNKIIFLKK